MFEELNNEITSKQEGHGADNCLRGAFAAAVFGPKADSLGKDLDKNGGQHETRAECDEILKQALAESVNTGFD
jgi:hypothetical protein